MALSPQTRKKLLRFRSLKRGWWSFLALAILTLIALFAELIASNRALIASHDGHWRFPSYGSIIPGTEFGEDYSHETNYRELQQKKAVSGNGWVLMPLIPWDATQTDSQPGVQHPAPPDFARRHFLGTDKTGRDVLCRLIYGYRNNMGFAIVFTILVFISGTTIGCFMGYAGGKVDLLIQRVMEIWQSVPFLFVVMIGVSVMPADLPVMWRIAALLGIMVLFSWMGITSYMRTSTYKEKARDYVASARALGASTGRLIFRHILPNTLATLVTFLPFTVASAISSLTALDFLNFGLPAPTPSWGELLYQGTQNLYAPWLVISAFAALASVLILVTFTGEAVREAFDPKKYTRYE